MADILDRFVTGLIEILSKNLKSIVLYGSKAAAEDNTESSDYNILVIVEHLNIADLKALNPIIRFWTKARNPAPLIFTMDELKESLDVFPIEFFEIKNSRKILFGEDPFIDIDFALTNLRHQCEYELKNKLLLLRQKYLMYSANRSKLLFSAKESIASVIVVLKNVIRIFGKIPSKNKYEALDLLSQLTGVDTSSLKSIMEIKRGNLNPQKLDIDVLFGEYLFVLEKISSIVDGLNT